MAVKNKRIRVYMLQDVGADGRADMRYVLQPSAAADGAYYAAVSFVSSKESVVGAQAQRTALYDVTTSRVVPYTLPNCDGYITVLPDETQILRINSVAELYNTRERQARCTEASDTGVTLTT